jgi:hypothetical protein
LGAVWGCGESDWQGGWTALIWAAWNGRADCVRLLIDAGADMETKNHVRRRLSRLLVLFLFPYSTVVCLIMYFSSL